MKKTIVLGLIALGLAACADTRNAISKDSGEWNRNVYSVGRDSQELNAQQQEIAKQGEYVRAYGNTPEIAPSTTPQVHHIH